MKSKVILTALVLFVVSTMFIQTVYAEPQSFFQRLRSIIRNTGRTIRERAKERFQREGVSPEDQEAIGEIKEEGIYT